MAADRCDLPRPAEGTAESPAVAQLAEDYVRCRVLLGRTKAQVHQLLGRPDLTSSDTDFSTNGYDWEYTLGEDKTVANQAEHLLLDFNRAGRVRRVGSASATGSARTAGVAASARLVLRGAG